MLALKANFLRPLLRPYAPAATALIVFSFFTALLMLVPSIYMIQVSERVMLSRNETTLFFLTAIALFLLCVLAIIDSIRCRVLRRIAITIDDQLSENVFDALSRHSAKMTMPTKGLVLNDLNTFRDFISGGTIIYLMDLVWVPMIIGIVFLLHPFLGVAMLVVLLVTLALTLITQWIAFEDTQSGQAASAKSNEFARAVIRNAESLRAMGMVPALGGHWKKEHQKGIAWQSAAVSRAEPFTAALNFIRQSQVICLMVVGTALFVMQQVSAGVAFAVVFVGIRAIAPVAAVASSWRVINGASNAVLRLDAVLSSTELAKPMMSFPRPEGQVVASRIVLTPENSDKIVLTDVSFKLGAGRVLGVVGPSGAGKSSLAKLLTGAWRPRRGSISIDGNDLAHWHQDELGKFIGYVPQDVEFLPGSVAQNIARFDANMAACHGAVLEAAQLAGVQDVIQALPEGYDTLIGPDGYAFSGGQRQLLALARALYGVPSLVVLDEPNSNLDAVGEKSLGNTLNMLRSRSCTVIIITHRVNMLAFCDDVLVMSSGTVHTFGPRELIMKKLPTINGPRAETQLLGQAG